jgi:hypothetical protein
MLLRRSKQDFQVGNHSNLGNHTLNLEVLEVLVLSGPLGHFPQIKVNPF